MGILINTETEQPVLRCDQCGEVIQKGEQCSVICGSDIKEKEQIFYVVHKGECEKRFRFGFLNYELVIVIDLVDFCKKIIHYLTV